MHPMLLVPGSGDRSIWVSYCKTYLIPCLETHKPLDLVIILLGTNDLKMRLSVSAYDIANLCAGPDRAEKRDWPWRRAARYESIEPPSARHLEDVAPLGVGTGLAGWGYNGEREREAAAAAGHVVLEPGRVEAQLFGRLARS